MTKTKKQLSFLYFFTVAFWGVFYYFLPFAGDDWAWGSSVGLDRLSNWFDGYNGRYVGNLLIMLVTRSVVAKLIVCTAVMFLLVFVLSKIFDNVSKVKNSATNYIIAFSSVLLLVLPNQIAFGELQPFQIFGSTVGWLSGFTNYVVPSALILVYYYYVTNSEIDNKLIYGLLFFDGAVACLCVEHYTLFCLLFSFFTIAYRFFFFKKICKKSISFFAGSFVGALIMFTNSSYLSMQKGDASNKQRAVGLIGSFKQYAVYVLGENANQVAVIIFDVVLFSAICSFLIFFFNKSLKAIKNKDVSKLLPMICLMVMTLPLLVTNSGKEIYVVAPRCYFLQYFMIVIYLYRKFAEKDIAFNAKFSVGLKTTFAVLLIITCVVYFRLDYMGIVRENRANDCIEKNNSVVEVVEYPKSIEHIQWSSNFIKKETYLKRYQKYKNIPNDKELVVISTEK